MTKRKRDYNECDERLQTPTDNTDIFGRIIPKSKKRKIDKLQNKNTECDVINDSETEIESDERLQHATENTDIFGRIIPKSNNATTLEKIRSKLKHNNDDNDNVNKIQKKLQKLTEKELEKESKRDGLDKHDIINWERYNIKQIDYKLDETRFEHEMSNIVKQQKTMNNRNILIKSINDKHDEEISNNKISNINNSMPNEVDQKHFDAIFSKPKLDQITCSQNKMVVKDDSNGLNKMNDTLQCNKDEEKPKRSKKKKSWRQRVKKYQAQ